MSPPKPKKEGRKAIQSAQQHSHTNYISILMAEDVEIALRRSVCDALLGFQCAHEFERCDSVIAEHVAFYTTVVERGVGIPLHPFFLDVLDFYNLAIAQLSPVSWCYMLETLILFTGMIWVFPP